MSNLNDVITYGTAKFRVVKNITSENLNYFNDLPVGTILSYSGNSNTPPATYLFCEGQTISRTMYNDLFSIIGITYGSGDGETTFNLPDLRDKFIEGNNVAGINKEAGLPNITGYANIRITSTSYGTDSLRVATSGALVEDGNVAATHFKFTQSTTASDTYPTGMRLNASKSSSVYSDSVTTVQPPALTMKFIIKAFNEQTFESSLIDITQYTNELNQKFDYRNDFTIIYPNGGTKENPANISIDSTYAINNPFPGFYVYCIAEILYNDTWIPIINTMDDYGSGSHSWGVTTGQLNDNLIVINTGKTGLVIAAGSIINGLRIDNVPTPCRVKVWKIGKIKDT